MPVEIDRLIMLVIVGISSRIWKHCFKIAVGIRSKSQLVSGNWDRSLETSSVVSQGKKSKWGVNGGGKLGDAEIWLISTLVWSLWMLLWINVVQLF